MTKLSWLMQFYWVIGGTLIGWNMEPRDPRSIINESRLSIGLKQCSQNEFRLARNPSPASSRIFLLKQRDEKRDLMRDKRTKAE